MNRSCLLSLLLVNCVSVPLYAGFGPFLGLLGNQLDGGQSFVKTVEKTVAELSEQAQKAAQKQEIYESALKDVKLRDAELEKEINQLQGTDLDYASLRRDIGTKTNQVLVDIIGVYGQTQDILAEHRRMLEEYKQDPTFKDKGLQLEEKSIYGIDDYQKVNAMSLRLDADIKSLEAEKENLAANVSALKKDLESKTQTLEDKKQEQKDLKDQKPEERFERAPFSDTQRSDLLDAETRLAAYNRDLVEARLREVAARLQFLELRVRLKKLRRDMVRKYEVHVRQEMRVDRRDIEQTEQALKQQQERAQNSQRQYTAYIDELKQDVQGKKKAIERLKTQGKLSDADVDRIYQWTFEPTSLAGWRQLLEIGLRHNLVAYDIEPQIKLFQAKSDQEKALVTDKEVDTLVINTWERLTTGVLDSSSDALTKELKKYDKVLADLESSLAALEDKRHVATRLLTENAQIAEQVRTHIADLKKLKETTFKDDPRQFMQFGSLLETEAYIDAKKRSETIQNLLSEYGYIASIRTETIRKLDMVRRVLQKKSQEQLLPPLVSGIKKFIPDVRYFAMYMTLPGQIQASTQQMKDRIVNWSWQTMSSPSALFWFLGIVLAIVGIYIFLRRYLVKIGEIISNLAVPEYGMFTGIIGFVGMLVQSLAQHVTGMYLWALAYLVVRSGFVNTYYAVLFYLISIPLWLYYVNRFILYARTTNLSRSYQFTTKNYHERFFLLLSFLLSVTVIILFFKTALSKVLPASEAPLIMQAINIIIFQVTLILMISREQILQFIPRNTALGKWLLEQMEEYYQLFLAALIFIIIMSNPYIGGTRFLYLIGRIALVAILIPLVLTLHNTVKANVSQLFFVIDDEGRQVDRFPYGRTSYGFFVIASFIFFSVLGLILAANIWGFEVGWQEIVSFLKRDRYSYKDPDTNLLVGIDLLHVMRVFVYGALVIGGAFTISRFFLRRMFEALLVNPGVQGIIMSLTRYVIVFLTVVIGLQNLGLGGSLNYIFIGIAGLGVAGKEVIADFIGYFMILIQRPLKIGDFISIGPDLIGVVRHLNFRSVILRRRNSLTVIVPNSYILNRPLVNWNYYRTYFAFDDILITISYDADPEAVKALFLQVLDDNYNVLRNPAPIVQLKDFADQGFLFRVRGFLSHDRVLDQYEIASDVRIQLVKALREKGYELGIPVCLFKTQAAHKPQTIIDASQDSAPPEES